MALLGILMLPSCTEKAGDYKKFTEDPFLYSKTVKKLNDVVLENNFPPMIATRNYAYANIAAYETVAAGNDQFKSLSGQIKHLPVMPNRKRVKKLIFLSLHYFHFAKSVMRSLFLKEA